MKRSVSIFLVILALGFVINSSAMAQATIKIGSVPYGKLADAIFEAGDGDLIEISGGTLTEKDITVKSGKNITIKGAGLGTTIIQANTAAALSQVPPANGRIFIIEKGATVNIEDLTLQNGRSPVGIGFGTDGEDGGAIYNSGTLTLTRCELKENRAGNGATGGSWKCKHLRYTQTFSNRKWN